MARKVNKLKIDYSQQDQHISETAISPLIDNCYAIYGDYVNSSRHVCELLSGIKPVYKRMIETALELPDKLTKTATIAGQCMSCLPGWTKISVLDNNIQYEVPISKLAQIRTGFKVKSFNKKLRKFEWVTPEDCRVMNEVTELQRIKFEHLGSVTCTKDHKFLTIDHMGGSYELDKKLKHSKWVEASELREGDLLISDSDTFHGIMKVDSNTLVKYSKPIKVYTFINAGVDHNYVTGRSGVVSKNCYHPHSSQDAVVNALVRWGIFDGKGSHGMYLPTEYIGPAAPRYTEAKLNPTWRAQISKLMPYVPTFKNDLGYDEAYYIPTPIPLTCAFGGSGIGIGLAPRMVAFDMKSMIDAYRKNDYHLLEANFGLKLLDKESLKSIWETGEGRATYSYHIDKGTSEDGYYGTYIRGSCEAFVPKMGRLNQWKMEGKLLIRDESSAENGNCIFIARGKRISTITDEEIDKEINRVFIKKLPCKLYATFNGVTRPIGLKDWIGICYSNYCSLINKYKDETVKSIEFQQEVFRHFTDVAKTIIGDKEGKLSDQEIATKCKCSKEVVAAIAAKSIRTLQKLEPESKIQKLEKDKQSILAINENKYIDELINSVNV